jgi:hypothetical protein
MTDAHCVKDSTLILAMGEATQELQCVATAMNLRAA